MNLMYAEMLKASDDPLASDAHRGLDFSKVRSGSNFIITSMGVLSNENKAEYLQSISKYLTNNRKITSLAKKVDSNSMVALASVQLSIDAIRNINLWWNGKISGERCTKTIVDAAITVGGGIGGCALGSAVGSYFGSIGSNIGSYVGGLLGTQFASIISDRLTQEIFGLPKDVALENAYIYFGLPITASNTEINAAYRALCRKHHPDKGGKRGEFELVQAHMTLIKNARESL